LFCCAGCARTHSSGTNRAATNRISHEN
jgi:hypothetical protein